MNDLGTINIQIWTIWFVSLLIFTLKSREFYNVLYNFLILKFIIYNFSLFATASNSNLNCLGDNNTLLWFNLISSLPV